MKHKEIMMRLAVLGISTTMLCFSPVTLLAMEYKAEVVENRSLTSIKAVADENGFVIEDGVLLEYTGTERNVVIPNTVTQIGESAFSDNCFLEKIEIPNSVMLIGKRVFLGCSNLKEVVIPNGVTEIREYTFLGCSSLMEIEIPDSVMEIGHGAFSGCSSLTEIKIPDVVTKIEDLAFDNCVNLKEVVIPNGVMKIGKRVFSNCRSLTEIVIPNGITEIGYGVFAGCSSLMEVVIPNGVTEIREYAFLGCSSLMEIEIPDSVTEIGYGAFTNCSGLTIYGYADSYAQTYAQENHIPFVELEKEENPDDTQQPQENPFTDVSESMYYYKPVLWAKEVGITAGISATEFAPEHSCTRGQVVTFLWRAMGCPEPTSKTNPFIDVPEYEYYYKAVLWALENEITAGTDATHFAPNDNVTRGQFVTFLHRAESKPSYSVSNPFADVSNSIYYYDAVLWAYENGVTAGTDSIHFAPEDACTRGQVVTFLYRALEK